MQKKPRGKLDMENFLVDLSDLLRAGIDIDFALVILSEQSSRHAADAGELRTYLRSGYSLSRAFALIQFPQSIVSFVRISEMTGELDRVLQRTGEFLAQQRVRKEKIIKLFSYPLLLVALSTAVLYVLAVVVMPNFETMYNSMHLQLTPSTRFIFFMSRLIVLWLPSGLLICTALLGIGFIFHRRILPLIVRIFFLQSGLRSIIQVWKGREVMEMMSFLLSAGVDLLSMLQVFVEIDAAHMGSQWNEVIRMLENGQPFSKAISNISLLPRLVTEMVAIAETTGNLDQTAERLHLHLERVIDRFLERSVRVIEPSLTIMLGFTVGGATLFLMMPMLAMVRQLS